MVVLWVCLYSLCFESYPFVRTKHTLEHEAWVKSIIDDLKDKKIPRFPKEHPSYSPQLEALLLELFNYDPAKRAGMATLRASPGFKDNETRDVPFREKVSDTLEVGKSCLRQAHFRLDRWADDIYRGIRAL
jgi:hypothetical protein